MDISGYLYDNLPQLLENQEEFQDECPQFISKLNYNKSLFRIQSPEPSIQGDCLTNGNDQSYEIALGEFKFHTEEKNGNSQEQLKGPSKKTSKAKKLDNKRKQKNRPLSEEEFVDIMKKLEQCQYVIGMIDNMVIILNGFKSQLQQQTMDRTQ
ncbi:unnamed protein product [Paramecium pentaurelia]|uniref:Uncharacterized protein n=1 Tax=Paramecium pentaurelia TaxID=43138 RepID=A0A8S1TXH4_9CILI|nr:unnamed protein product [Paramecium pentaurelia]